MSPAERQDCGTAIGSRPDRRSWSPGEARHAVTLVGASAQLRLNVLGGFSLRSADRSVHLPGTAQRLLAFVALQRRPVARDQVAFTLWPDVSETHAHGSLRTAFFELRRPGHDLLRATGGDVHLGPGLAVDLDEMLSLVDQIRADRIRDALSGVERDLLEADLLPGWYDDWVIAQQERHRELRVQTLERLCTAQMEAGRYADAVSTGSAAIRADPTRDSSARLIIAAHIATGNEAQAVVQYRRFEERLREFGLVPSARTTALIASIAGTLTLA
jgi:SARP family transcriptional regulator, regulator of embCAB operon